MLHKPSHQETPHSPQYQWLMFCQIGQFDLAVSDQWMCWPFSRTCHSKKKKYLLTVKKNKISMITISRMTNLLFWNVYIGYSIGLETERKESQEMSCTWCAEIRKRWASPARMEKSSLCRPPERWPCSLTAPALASNPRASTCSLVRIPRCPAGSRPD